MHEQSASQLKQQGRTNPYTLILWDTQNNCTKCLWLNNAIAREASVR